MRVQRLVSIGVAGVLLTACGPSTECADIGGVPGVQIVADGYVSDATGGHSVEVCVEDACGTTLLGDQFPFVTLDDLREEEETTSVVVVRDEEQQPVMRTSLVASPDRFKPGGQACEFSVALLRLSLAADGTAQVVSGS